MQNKNFTEMAVRQINASCPEKIDAETLIASLKTGRRDGKWDPHLWAFLEELPVPLVHDVVLSSTLTFEELAKAIEIWECLDGPTTDWIREMAELSMETAA